MIKLDKTPKNYTIRVPDTSGDQIISGFATMRYKAADDVSEPKIYINYGRLNTTANVTSLDLRSLWPYPPVELAQEADQLINLAMGRLNLSYQWTLQGSEPYDVMANYDDPILFDLSVREDLGDIVTIETKNGTWVDVLQLGVMPQTSSRQAPHVIHKHSNKAFIIGFGQGFFNWISVEEAETAQPSLFELEHPRLRDTLVTNGLTGPTWIMRRYQVVNPGPFLLHCHIETHLANGMEVALLDGVNQWPQVPSQYAI